jgi:hypothetical protein
MMKGFRSLLKSWKNTRKSYFLIDEYDKPILDNAIKENISSIREVFAQTLKRFTKEWYFYGYI